MILRAGTRFACCLMLLLVAHSGWSQEIDPVSVTSLNLKLLHNEAVIGAATGFVMAKGNKYYLITNRHVVLACRLDSERTNIGGWICANKLQILHNRLSRVGEWLWVTEELLDNDGKKRWFEHPTLSGGADIVALPLTHVDNVQFFPLDIELTNTDVVVGPGDTVSIVGFPFGQAQSAGLPIWKTGTIASDSDVNWSDRPMFLVDTTSRPGMSGSPVYAVRTGSFRTSKGELKMVTSGSLKRFLGVYSEQYQEAELGGVWKATALLALYESLP